MTSPGGHPDATAAGASRTALAQLVARSVGILAQALSLAIVARELGTSFVEWGSVVSLVAIVSFALDPGISPVVVRRLAQEPASAPLPTPLGWVRAGAALFSVVVVVIAALVLRGPGTLLLALALGAQLLPRAMVLNATPWLQTDQRLHRVAAYEAVAAAGGVLALGLAAGAGAPAPVLGLLGFTLPVSVVAILVRREVRITPSRRLDVPGPQGPRLRSLLREVAPLAGALLMLSLAARTYVVFLNAGSEADEVTGNFLFAFLFVEQLIVAVGITAGPVLPLLAARARGHDLLSDAVTQRLLTAVAGVGGLACAIIVGVAQPLVRVVGGPEQTAAAPLLTALAPVASVIFPAMVLAYVYVALGRARAYLWFTAVGLGLNLALNALLVLPYGATAAARLPWVTDLAVLVVPLLALARTGGGGAQTALRLLVVVATCVVGAELALAEVVPAAIGAGLILGATLASTGSALRWFLAAVGVRFPARRH